MREMMRERGLARRSEVMGIETEGRDDVNAWCRAKERDGRRRRAGATTTSSGENSSKAATTSVPSHITTKADATVVDDVCTSCVANV